MPKRSGSASKPSPRQPWVDPDDAPELTDEMLDRAEIVVDGRVVQLGQMPKGKSRPMLGKMLTDDPDDAPELLVDFFRRAEIVEGGRVLRPSRPPRGNKPSKG
jgi:hypothetical protein